MYTARLMSDCSVCHDRHVSMGHKNYLMHFAALPFKCEHGRKVVSMQVDDPDDQIHPFINLPSGVQKIAPDCMSDSSGGHLTVDKLEQDKSRLQTAFLTADEEFTNLAANVNNSGFDISRYPQ